jgi:hypothetical protein
VRIAALAILLIAAPAVAQTTTTCNRIGDTVNCFTTSPPPPVTFPTQTYTPPQQMDMSGWYALGAAIAARRRAHEEALERQRQEQRNEAFNMNLARFIQNGECDAAANMAIENGRYDALDAVKQFCHAPAPPTEAH